MLLKPWVITCLSIAYSLLQCNYELSLTLSPHVTSTVYILHPDCTYNFFKGNYTVCGLKLGPYEDYLLPTL